MIDSAYEIHSSVIPQLSANNKNNTTPTASENYAFNKNDDYSLSPAAKIANSSVSTKINSYEDYKRMRGTTNSPDIKIEAQLWGEYQDYLKIRGCSNERELIALNSTLMKDTETLRYTAQKIFSESMDDMNIDTEGFDIDYFVTNTDIADVAEFYNSMKNANGSLKELRTIRKFIETGLYNKNFEDDPEFKDEIVKLLEKLDKKIDFLEIKGT